MPSAYNKSRAKNQRISVVQKGLKWQQKCLLVVFEEGEREGAEKEEEKPSIRHARIAHQAVLESSQKSQYSKPKMILLLKTSNQKFTLPKDSEAHQVHITHIHAHLISMSLSVCDKRCSILLKNANKQQTLRHSKFYYARHKKVETLGWFRYIVCSRL
jgi:hypothetical protein